MKTYFLWCEGERRGPFALPQLEQMLGKSEITMQTLCAIQGEDKWLPLQEFVAQTPLRVEGGIFTHLPASPAPSARPQWLRVSDRADHAVLFGLVLIFVALGLVFVAIVAATTEGSLGPGILWTAAGFFGAGSWFVMLGQVMHIRAAAEQMARRE